MALSHTFYKPPDAYVREYVVAIFYSILTANSKCIADDGSTPVDNSVLLFKIAVPASRRLQVIIWSNIEASQL